jgi:hypothetical protein
MKMAGWPMRVRPLRLRLPSVQQNQLVRGTFVIAFRRGAWLAAT